MIPPSSAKHRSHNIYDREKDVTLYEWIDDNGTTPIARKTNDDDAKIHFQRALEPIRDWTVHAISKPF